MAFAPTLQAAAGGIVRNVPAIHGEIDGSLQVLAAGDITIGGRTWISGDLLVQGTPVIRLEGRGSVDQVINGIGNALPDHHVITLTGSASIHRLVQRTEPFVLVPVEAPAVPAGTRSIAISAQGVGIGDPATLRNLTLNGGAGAVTLPPGVYGVLTANGNGSFVLGSPGSSVPAVYELEALNLNGNAGLVLAGPVRLKLGGSLVLGGVVGEPALPDWLQIDLAGQSTVVLNGGAKLYARVNAPEGGLRLNGNAEFSGSFRVADLVMVGNSVLRLTGADANLPPLVELTAPLEGTRFPAPASLTLLAAASDPDGVVTRVEFFNDGSLLGTATATPHAYHWENIPVGTQVVTARAFDEHGASTTSLPVTFQVIVNAAPEVSLLQPFEGSSWVAPAAVGMIARATDPDGPVVRVEFFGDGELLGTSSAPSEPPDLFTFTATLGPGRRLLLARAHDADGAFADSTATAIRVYPGIPYLVDFETDEQYQVGFLDEQQGWSVPRGAALVQAGQAVSGLQSIVLLPADPVTQIRQDFISEPAGVIFLDVHVRLVAGDDIVASAIFESTHGRVGVLRRAEVAELMVFDGADGAWKPTTVPVFLPLAPDGPTTDWIRLTFREDYATGTWDLYVNGVLMAIDLGFREPEGEVFTTLAVTGNTTLSTYFDDVFIGGANPVFADVELDGIEDAYEIAHGLDPTRDDRAGDADGDGLSNIQEYLLGTRTEHMDTDGDGLPDAWEVRYGLNPLADSTDADPDGDGVPNLEEYLLGRNPVKGTIAAPAGIVNLRVFSPRE